MAQVKKKPLSGSGSLTPQQKAVATTKDKHGDDFYKVIGKRAGQLSPSAPFRDQEGLATKAINARWDRYRAMSDKEKLAYRAKLRANRKAKKQAKK